METKDLIEAGLVAEGNCSCTTPVGTTESQGCSEDSPAVKVYAGTDDGGREKEEAVCGCGTGEGPSAAPVTLNPEPRTSDYYQIKNEVPKRFDHPGINTIQCCECGLASSLALHLSLMLKRSGLQRQTSSWLIDYVLFCVVLQTGLWVTGLTHLPIHSTRHQLKPSGESLRELCTCTDPRYPFLIQNQTCKIGLPTLNFKPARQATISDAGGQGCLTIRNWSFQIRGKNGSLLTSGHNV